MLLIIATIVRTLQLTFTLGVVSSVLVSAACFFPDGSVAQDTPCTDSTAESTCCGTGYACFGHESSFFLCQATGEEFQKPGASQYVRGSCTDSSWRSSNCPNVCVDPNRDNTAGGHGVDSCPDSDTLFYCISEGLGVENCSTGFNLIDFGATPSVLTTIGVLPSTTSPPSSTPSSVSTVDNVPAPDSTSPTNTAAKTKDGSAPLETSPSPPPATSSSSGTTIGIAVGVSIGVLALLGAGLFAWFLMRKRGKQEALPNTPNNGMSDKIDPNQNFGGGMAAGEPMYAVEHYKQGPLAGSELHGSYVYTPAPSEVPANEHVAMYELPGGVNPGPRELDSQLRRD